MSSSRLCIATATSPVSLQEHEIDPRHRAVVRCHSAEDTTAERPFVTIPQIFARFFVSPVCKQCEVAVRPSVAFSERFGLVIDLPKIHTAAYTITENILAAAEQVKHQNGRHWRSHEVVWGYVPHHFFLKIWVLQFVQICIEKPKVAGGGEKLFW